MTNLQKAKNFGALMADEWFKDFQNSEFRGPNFTWEKFPNLVSRMAKKSCFLNFHINVKNIEKLKEEAGKAAYNRALELIKTI